MIISKEIFLELKNTPNCGYDELKCEFLFHSNKMEGSTFSIDNLEKAIYNQTIEGNHSIDDVVETINSIELFDFVIDTLDEPLSSRLIREYHGLLKQNTSDAKKGFAGNWKRIPNKISGIDLKLALPHEVPERINSLLDGYSKSEKNIEDVLRFHCDFEHIHPFQDGNGRVGRFLLLRECINNNLPLVAIDSEYEKDYKEALLTYQSKNIIKPLMDVSQKCIERLDSKLVFLTETIDYIKNNLVRTNNKERFSFDNVSEKEKNNEYEL